mmetsp:Transcript_40915/g.135527  ORF Transcript_40915/g.135527 Transcript_40915/m.135527 type:complete len:212 (+) Transcript_40915:750-1385(+)
MPALSLQPKAWRGTPRWAKRLRFPPRGPSLHHRRRERSCFRPPHRQLSRPAQQKSVTRAKQRRYRNAATRSRVSRLAIPMKSRSIRLVAQLAPALPVPRGELRAPLVTPARSKTKTVALEVVHFVRRRRRRGRRRRRLAPRCGQRKARCRSTGRGSCQFRHRSNATSRRRPPCTCPQRKRELGAATSQRALEAVPVVPPSRRRRQFAGTAS